MQKCRLLADKLHNNIQGNVNDCEMQYACIFSNKSIEPVHVSLLNVNIMITLQFLMLQQVEC